MISVCWNEIRFRDSQLYFTTVFATAATVAAAIAFIDVGMIAL